MTRPAVSVVIPGFNAERTIVETVSSALGQSFDDLEVIVVDDGSRDATAERAGAIADPRVRVLRQANGGASAARNRGIADARGRFVAFLDSDDTWLPHKLAVQMRQVEAGSVAVQAGALFVDDAGRVVSSRPCRDSEDPVLDTLRFENLPAFASTLLIEREALLALGGFDSSLVILEDWDLALRISLRHGLHGIPEPLVRYRQHPGNRSRDIGIHVAPGFQVLRRTFGPDADLPERYRGLRRTAYGAFFRMLAGGYFQSRQPARFAYWSARAVAANPVELAYFAALPLRWWRRRPTRAVARGGNP